MLTSVNRSSKRRARSTYRSVGHFRSGSKSLALGFKRIKSGVPCPAAFALDNRPYFLLDSRRSDELGRNQICRAVFSLRRSGVCQGLAPKPRPSFENSGWYGCRGCKATDESSNHRGKGLLRKKCEIRHVLSRPIKTSMPPMSAKKTPDRSRLSIPSSRIRLSALKAWRPASKILLCPTVTTFSSGMRCITSRMKRFSSNTRK